MRLARVRTAGGEILHGVVRGDSLGVIEGDLFGSRRESPSRVLPLKELRLLAPIAPANLLCLGRNYRAHAAEGGDAPPKAPLLFIKATSCVIGPDDPIVIPQAAPGCVAHVLLQILWRAMRGDDPGLAGDAEFSQHIGGGLHRGPVRVAAHENSHKRFARCV